MEASMRISTTGNAVLTLPLGSGSGVLSQEFSFNRPRLLIEGAWGMGQAHVARAVLHALEEIPVFTLALSALVAAKGGESIDVVPPPHRRSEAERAVRSIHAIDTLGEHWCRCGALFVRHYEMNPLYPYA